MVDILRSLFENAHITIRYQQRFLHAIPIRVGLLQGAVLSTSLFNKFIDPLLQRIANHTVGATIFNGKPIPLVAFADDITLLVNAQPQSIERLKRQLLECEQFALARGFRFNPSKCLTTAAPDVLARFSHLRLHGEPIQSAPTADILGCKFSSACFDADAHISDLIQRTLAATNLLAFSGLFRSAVSLYRKAILAKAFARSHMEYGLQFIAHQPLATEP